MKTISFSRIGIRSGLRDRHRGFPVAAIILSKVHVANHWDKAEAAQIFALSQPEGMLMLC
jgi:hypothetical protein